MNDWFETRVRLYRTFAVLPPDPWATGEPEPTAPAALVQDMRWVVRAHGVPPQCALELADLGPGAAGCATFADAPAAFNVPVIRIGKSIPAHVPPRDLQPVHRGVAVHEGNHILFTREAFRRPPGRSARRMLYENLYEDERVDALGQAASPGLVRYLEAAREALLVRGEPGKAMTEWDALPDDLARIGALIFAFVRLPHAIPPGPRHWTAANGECVFDTLRALFPFAPADEADVERMAAETEGLWDRLAALYPRPPEPPAPPPNAPRGGTNGPPIPTAGDASAFERLQQLGRQSGSASDGTSRSEVGAEDPFGVAARMIGRRRMRMEMPTADTEPDAPGGSVVVPDEWTWGQNRRTVIERPRATADDERKYRDIVAEVRPLVAAMRSAMQFRAAARSRVERAKPSGRLDTRALATGPLTGRAFRRTPPHVARGLALGLLLDESGSMSSVDGSGIVRATAARQSAVLLAEALRDTPGVQFEIYSHSSCGTGGQDCLVRHLYGRGVRSPAALAGFGPRHSNYDHQAILTAARQLEAATTYPDRVLVVACDGQPSGVGYGGPEAIRATREAVEAVRRRGIRVICVAVADYNCEAIFGSAHIARFTDLARLPGELRKLIARLVRDAAG